MDELISKILILFQKDNLKSALEHLRDYCAQYEVEEDFTLEIDYALAQLSRVKADWLKSLISTAEYYRHLNKIRKSILPIIQQLKDSDHEHLRRLDRITPVLQEGIANSERLINQNQRLDALFKILLFAVLFAGFGILLFSISAERILEEKIYLGSISMTGIFSSFYFYTRLRGIELMRYRTT